MAKSKAPAFDGKIPISQDMKEQLYSAPLDSTSVKHGFWSNINWVDFSVPTELEFQFDRLDSSDSGSPLVWAKNSGTEYAFAGDNADKFIMMSQLGVAKLNVVGRRHSARPSSGMACYSLRIV